MSTTAPIGRPSDDQQLALAAFEAFLGNPDEQVFVLSGAAGTGKTTLLGAMLGVAEASHRRSHLAALTGRATSIVRQRTGRDASTLHSYLYRFDPRASRVVDGVPQLIFALRDELPDGASVLFVDEASMLGALVDDLSAMQFGSGRPAADLVELLFGRHPLGSHGRKLVLVGDPFQLPPVGEERSIAFSPDEWDRLVLDVLGSTPATRRMELTTIHRQREGGILDLATRYRDGLVNGDFRATPMVPPDDPEVTASSTGGGSLLPWARTVASDPTDRVVIGHTNAGVATWNRLVRQERWGDPDLAICRGDLIVNTRWDPRTDLDNGEILRIHDALPTVRVVAHLGREVHLRDVSVSRLAGDGGIFEALIADAALTSPDRTMARDDFQVLWVDFTQRHRGLRQSTPEFWDAARRDPILNPLVAKYGYALTCHKAQSGQWGHAIVDFNGLAMAPDSEEGFRWAYTAVTRAERRLDLIDPPHRSPFSRLGPRPRQAAADGREVSMELPGRDIRRASAEQACEEWAAAAGVDLRPVDRKTHNTRYEARSGVHLTSFDVFFNAEGLVTSRVLVRSTAPAVDDQMPSLRLLERASFRGFPRPTDARIDADLARLEEVLRAAGLDVHYRRTVDWAIELEMGRGADFGVLLLHFRKTGVFSRVTWRRAPGADLRSAVDHVLETLTYG